MKESEIANLYLGHCYRDSGDKEKARGFYEIVLKINPDNLDALKEIEKLIPDFTPPPSVRPAEPEEKEAEAILAEKQSNDRESH